MDKKTDKQAITLTDKNGRVKIKNIKKAAEFLAKTSYIRVE